MAEAVAIDTAGRRVTLADGAVSYDYLVVATGATHSYFGNDAWAVHAPGSSRSRMPSRSGAASSWPTRAPSGRRSPALQRQWLTFVIIGAGPTGVEMAGALAEISRQALSSHEFRNVDPKSARIILVEGTSRVLPPYPPELSVRAKKQLEGLSVEVWTGALVTAIDERSVSLGEERILARTVVWAAGVQASPLVRSLGVPLDRAGRVLVTPQLTIPGHDDVFVVGDLVALEQDGKPIPGVCPSAIQEGRHAAGNVLRAIRGERLEAFRYRDKGSFATIGRGAAVGDARRAGSKMWGFLAWIAWMAHPHLLPHRFPEPGPRDVPVGVLVPDVPARGPPHHRGAAR